MKRYLITYKNKKVISKGNDCEEALERYSNRPVFGDYSGRIFSWRLKMYDADTRGKKWAEYVSEGYQSNFSISVELVS